MSNTNPLPFSASLLITSKEGVKPFYFTFLNNKTACKNTVNSNEVYDTLALENMQALVGISKNAYNRLFHYNKIYNLTFNVPTYFADFTTDLHKCPPGFVTFEKGFENNKEEPVTLKHNLQYRNKEAIKAETTFNYFYFVSKTAVDAVFPTNADKVYAEDFFLANFLYHRDLSQHHYFLFKGEGARQHFLDTLAKINPALPALVPTFCCDTMTSVFEYALGTSFQDDHGARNPEEQVHHKFHVLTSTNAGNAKYLEELKVFLKDETLLPEQVVHRDRFTDTYSGELNPAFLEKYLTHNQEHFADSTLEALKPLAKDPVLLDLVVTGSYSTELNSNCHRQILDFLYNRALFAPVSETTDKKRVFVEVASLLANADFIAQLSHFFANHFHHQQEQKALFEAFKEAMRGTEAFEILETKPENPLFHSPYTFYFSDPKLETLTKLQGLFAQQDGFNLEISNNRAELYFNDPTVANDSPSLVANFVLLEKFNQDTIIKAIDNFHYAVEVNN